MVQLSAHLTHFPETPANPTGHEVTQSFPLKKKPVLQTWQSVLEVQVAQLALQLLQVPSAVLRKVGPAVHFVQAVLLEHSSHPVGQASHLSEAKTNFGLHLVHLAASAEQSAQLVSAQGLQRVLSAASGANPAAHFSQSPASFGSAVLALHFSQLSLHLVH